MEWITIMLEGEEYVCTTDTQIFLFPREMSTRNHIFIRNNGPDEPGIYIFGRMDMIAQFIRSGNYVCMYIPWVSDEDEAAYQMWVAAQAETYEEEVAEAITEEEIAEMHEQLKAEGSVIEHWDELEEE